MPLDLLYFYGHEAEQYSFYRIPKALLADAHFKGISIEAKLLYGLMLDRMGLSVRNGWLDEQSRVYIYFTLEDAMETMGCGHNKAVKLFADLDQIGLIERKKQGQGKPTIIYVKNFVLPPVDGQPPASDRPEPPESSQTSDLGKSTIPVHQEAKASDLGKSALPGKGSQDVSKSDTNKTDKNKTDLNDTELSIYPPTPLPHRPRSAPGRANQMEAYRTILRENISYDLLVRDYGMDADLIDGYVELMAEICGSSRETVRINQDDLPTDEVRNRFLKLDMTHIAYVMDCLSRNTSRVTNIRAYTLSALYNAPATMDQYYVEQVSHDIAQRRREAGA